MNGKIEAVIGPMYSGKTEELIRRVVRRNIARQRGTIFKISSDTRNKEKNVVSRAGTSLSATTVESARDTLKYLEENMDYVAFDEAQFFGEELFNVVNLFIGRGTDVIVAGLNLDFRGEPFNNVMKIVAIADEVVLLKAVCVVCGKDATRTQRLILKEGQWLPASLNDPIFKVEGEDVQTRYEPRCKDCWKVGDNMAKVGKHMDVTPEIYDDGKEAKGVEKRVLIGPKDGAPTFIMRHFTMKAGGFTPHHSHPWEHEVYILKGKGFLRTNVGKKPFETGDYVFVPPNEIHQFVNDSDETLEFVCVIPKSGN